MWMWRSILPGRSNASSSFSMWLVVKTKILSLPQHDHKPSVKFKRPERVILPPSALSNFVASCSLNVSLEAAEVNLERVEPAKILLTLSPASYMFDICRFCFHSFEVYSIDSSKMVGNSPEVLNFNLYFSISTGSSVTNHWFSPSPASQLMCGTLEIGQPLPMVDTTILKLDSTLMLHRQL